MGFESYFVLWSLKGYYLSRNDGFWAQCRTRATFTDDDTRSKILQLQNQFVIPLVWCQKSLRGGPLNRKTEKSVALLTCYLDQIIPCDSGVSSFLEGLQVLRTDRQTNGPKYYFLLITIKGEIYDDKWSFLKAIFAGISFYSHNHISSFRYLHFTVYENHPESLIWQHELRLVVTQK